MSTCSDQPAGLRVHSIRIYYNLVLLFFTLLLYGFSYSGIRMAGMMRAGHILKKLISPYLHHQDMQYCSLAAFLNNFAPLGLSST